MNPTGRLRQATDHFRSRLAKLRGKFGFLRDDPRLSLFWPTSALLIAVVGWMVLFDTLDRERREAEQRASFEASALARGYAEHLKRTLDAIDQVTLHVRLEWEVSNHKLRLETVKARGLFPDSAPFNVTITDRDGMGITSTYLSLSSSSPILNISDMPYYLAHRNASRDFLYISPPVSSRTSGNDVIHFSRRIESADGEFEGVVLITVLTDYFTVSYDEVTLGQYGFMGMVGTDGITRVTRTGSVVHSADIGSMVSTLEFPQPGGDIHLDGRHWFRDERSRFLGWDKVDNYPFYALAGLDEATALETYAERRRSAIFNGIAGSIALAVFTLIATTLSMRLAWRKHQMELTQATYRMATEGGNEGFYICRPILSPDNNPIDFCAVDCNQRGADFFRLRREEFIGRTLSFLHDRVAAERAIAMLRHAVKEGRFEGEVDITTERGSKRFLHLKAVRAHTAIESDLAVTLRDVTSEKAHLRELERRGNEDALTELPNRLWVQSYLPSALQQAESEDRMLALLFIDLDGFKSVNDSMGHAAGDELLRNASRRLKEAVRPRDHVVRFGGDEFVVILEHMAHEQDAAHVAQRVLNAFRENFRLSQGTASVGTSIGISVFPRDARNADALLQNADVAMYSVKTAGKRHYRFFDPRFYEALRSRLEREAELRHAIELDQFEMYYQPRIDILSGRTSSMEALVRWTHPRRGMVEPVEFISLAEESGLISDLGNLVIEKVFTQMADWIAAGQDPVPVSVNVSPRQFNENDMVRVFRSALGRHRIPPSLIEIELTESTMMGDAESVMHALNSLHNMGLRLLVDDFGTGYSSLSQLQRLDVDVLKVDKAFTAEIDKSGEGNVLFTAIITMAHALGIRVVAEGVENQRQLDILRNMQCDEVQGFLLSHPLPASSAEPMMSRQLLPIAV